MSDSVGLFAHVALIGIAGAAAMDLWGWVARRTLGIRGLDYGLLGRWVGHLSRGHLAHASIAAAPPVRAERAIGWMAHYAIGVGFALVLVVAVGREWVVAPTLWPALLVGWATLLAPWLILQPGMGAGIAGSRTPDPTATRLRNLATHTTYGLGLYLGAGALSLTWP